MTILRPDITRFPAHYHTPLTSNARRVVALQFTGVPDNPDHRDGQDGQDHRDSPTQPTLPALTGSRVGGLVFVSDAYPEPKDYAGDSMVFLAQLNLAELPQLDGYPSEGLLQFFIAGDDMLGMNVEEPHKVPSFMVRLIPPSEFDRGRLAMASQSDYTPLMGGYFAITGVLYDQLPNPMDKDFSAATGMADYADYSDDPEVQAVLDFLDEQPSSVYGAGWATFTQEDPRDSDSELELLFQLDCESDNGVEIMFGDAGVANFFITRADLAQRNFHKVFYTWDCC